jgi:hypothetical protein
MLEMTSNVSPRVPLILGGVFFVLACATTTLMFVNRSVQSDVNQRQIFINQSAQLGQVNQALIKSLAVSSVKNPAMRKLLSDFGLNVTYNSPAKSEAPSAADPAAASIPVKR